MTATASITAAEQAEFEARLTVAREEQTEPVVRYVGGAPVIWLPQEGSQQDFLACPLFEVLYHGNRGGGKTDALIMAYANHVGKGYGRAWRGVIFRQTYPQLADVQAKSEKWFRLIFPGARFNRSKMAWEFEGGEVLLFRHMSRPEDYWNYHGHELPFIGFEELTNWASPDCYTVMFACCRSSDKRVPRIVRATTNPYGVGHSWCKERWRLAGQWWKTITTTDSKDLAGKFEPPRCAIFGDVAENKILNEADPDYLDRIAAAATNKSMAAAWLKGSWDIVSGGMFGDVWNPQRNVVSPFDVPSSWKLDRSFDWGSSRPFSVGWWAQSDGTDLQLRDGRWLSTVRGDLFRVAEWYGFTGKANEGLRMLAVDIAAGIIEREIAWGWRRGRQCRVRAGVADSSIFAVENGVSIAMDMEKPVRVNGDIYHGISWVPADKKPGSRKSGWEMLRKMMGAATPKDGPREAPGLFVVGDQCEQFLRTVISLPRDEKDLDDVDCFVAGTMISTPFGDRRIETLREGELVDTPIGPRAVMRSHLSGLSPTVRVLLSNGLVLEGTPNHEVYVHGVGLVSLSALSCGLILTPEDYWSRRGSFAASLSGATLDAATSSVGARIGWGSRRSCIGRCGVFGVAQSQKGITCITETETRRTTGSGISISFTSQTTRECISKSVESRSGQLRRNGRKAHQGRTLSEATPPRCNVALRRANLRALLVAELVERATCARSSAASSARSPMRDASWRARSVVMTFGRSRTARSRFGRAAIRVVGLSADATPRLVFNLTVEQAGLYVASGVVCSNTDAEDHIADETRYRARMVGGGAKSGRTVGMF